MAGRGAFVIALAVCIGCYEAHGGAGADSGRPADATVSGPCLLVMDAGEGDDYVPPPEHSLCGFPSEEAIAMCGEVDGFVRCDECGQEACPDWTACVEGMGVCKGRHPTASRGCNFSLVPGDLVRNSYPQVPHPCVAHPSRDGSGDAPFSGLAIPVSYCVAAREVPDLPPQKCVYPDGTEVITGPPDDPCPGHRGDMVVCGGSCGEMLCLWGDRRGRYDAPCVGFSDTRAFGICSFGPTRCNASNVRELIAQCQEQRPPFMCRWYANPCACMVLDPQAVLPEWGPTGFIAPASACLEYQRYYPDQVECRDEHWNVL
jgi:hypothetical protein